MENIHRLLKRQLKRCFGDTPQIPEEWRQFIATVNAAYAEFDTDRETLERSLDLSSQELLQANSEMRAVFQAIPDLLFRLDQQGTILDFKAGLTRDVLLPPRELLGKRIQDVPLPQVGAQFREVIQRVIGENSLVSMEYALKLQGQECAFEARLVPLPENQIVAIIRNITERKRSDALLLKLSRAVEQTADAVLITDVAGIIEYVNPAFTALTGFTSSDVEGQTPRILKSGSQEVAFYANLWTTILGGKIFFGVMVNRKKTGELYYAETTITPLKDSSGRITHFVSTEKDITACRHLEDQLRQSQKMEAFGQLAAGVAHDFNNMLTAILGNLSLLKIGEVSAVECNEAITEATKAAERAANLTRQLLTFSRQQPMHLKNLDLNDVIANFTKMLQRIIGEDITLQVHFAPGGSPINADAGMMEQVMMNLAINSRDAMPKGGQLTLETGVVTLEQRQAQLKPKARPGEFVRLSVRDTGKGIAPEDLPHIFEPFFSTKEVGKGTGLGLATVFGIVEQHHGWIEVESELNVGSVFHVYLDRVDQHPPTLPKNLPQSSALQGTETILLVEDEDPIRHIVQRLLERNGYRVHPANSGVEAFEIWRRHRRTIDLLITDMIMPGGISGRELATRLNSENPKLKVIYCSGYTDDMLREDSPLRKNLNFLEKPFVLPQMLRLVRDILDAP